MAEQVRGAKFSGAKNVARRRRPRPGRKSKQRGFIVNPYVYGGGGGGPVAVQDPFYDLVESVASFDGTDTDTTFVDARAGDIWTFNGGAQLDDAQTAFGGDTTSLLLDGTGDYLTTPDDPRWQLSTSDYWTVEAMIRPGNVTAIKSFVSKRNDGATDGGFDFYVNASSKLRLLVWSGGSEVVSLTSTTSLTVDTWQHVAFVRYGTRWYISIDGVIEDEATESGTPTDNTDPLHIGRAITDSARDYDGHIAHLRITKGWSRWVNDFTAPTEAHPTELLASGRDPYLTNVAAHLTCRGVNGATSVIDEAGVTWGFGGDAAVTTDQSPIDGQTSIVLDGSGGDSFSFADSVIPGGMADRDFTIEMWVRFNDVSAGSRTFLSQYDASSGQRSFRFQRGSTGDLSFAYSTNGTTNTFVSGTWNPSADTWYHVAASRIGNELHLLADGVLIHTADVTGITFFNSSTLWRVGANNNGATSELLDGWVADVRITMDVGRYDADGYDVPTHLLPAYALFTPLMLSPEIWLDASDSDTITIATGVSQWNDKSGNGRNFTQTTSGAQPLVQSAEQNGLDVIRFDGSNDALFNFDAGVRALFQNVGYGGLFGVYKKVSSNSNDEHVFSFPTGSGGSRLTLMSGRGSANNETTLGVRRLDGDGFAALELGADLIAWSIAHVDMVWSDGDGFLYIDGELEQSNASLTSSGNTSNTAASRAATVGAFAGTTGSPTNPVTTQEANIDVGELFAFSEQPSASGRQALEGQLAHKWGLDGNLDSTHPHKWRPPVVSLAMLQ